MRRVPFGRKGLVRWGMNPLERVQLLKQQMSDLEPLVQHVGDREKEIQQDIDEIQGRIQLTRQQIQERIDYLRQFGKESVPALLDELQTMRERLEALGSVSEPADSKSKSEPEQEKPEPEGGR